MAVNSFTGQPAIPSSFGFTAGKNKIINGDFGVWQRGTSFSNPASNSYIADRWNFQYDGSGATRTISQQTFTPGTAPVAGYEGAFFYRYNQSVAGTGATYQDVLRQKIEDVRTFAGQTATLSFWAKADAARTLTIYVAQDFGTGGSALTLATVTNSSPTLTTSWARYTTTVVVPSVSGKTIGTNSNLYVDIQCAPNTALTIDIWGVQLEAGGVATAFQTATGTIQGELAACQRYYYRETATSSLYTWLSNAGFATSTTNVFVPQRPSVSMRITPSSVDFANLMVSDGATNTAVSALSVDANSSPTSISLNATSTGLTQFRPYALRANNTTNAYIGLNAEL